MGLEESSGNIVQGFVLERANAHPDEPAVVDAVTGNTVTRADLAAGAGRAAATLAAVGIRPEQRVMLVMADTAAFLEFFWGAIWLGAVPVPVSTMLTPKDYRFLISDSRAAAIIVSAPLAAAVGPAVSDQPHLHARLIDGNADDDFPVSVASAAAGSGEAPPVYPATGDDPAFWLYTSGTTGFPKGAIHRHADVPFLTDAYARGVLRMDSSDVVYSVAKLFFAYGLGNAGYFAAGTGASSVLNPARPTPEKVAAIVEEHQVTLFFSVPTFSAALLNSDVPDGSFASVRLGVSAGEPLPEDIYRRFLSRFGVELLDGIGTTELGHIFISQRAGRHRPESTGTPVAGFTIDIRDQHGEPVPAGEPGALWVAGESVMSGYWKRTNRNRAALWGPFMRTGDTYVENDDGSYTYLGRDDDMLKVGGIWVSPAEVEACIVELDEVVTAAVVGAADADGMIKPRAFVIPASGADPAALPTRVQDHVKSRLASFKYPRWVDVVEELPLTATGKVKRYLLRERPLRPQ